MFPLQLFILFLCSSSSSLNLAFHKVYWLMPALYKKLGSEMHVLWKYETIHQKKRERKENRKESNN